uniref:4-hydroxythreonine-4-phosphate dehydrogenase PdxA n=1 Tax=Sneathiella sp. TaxID=1964365 RepID=UPI003568DCC0
MSARAPLAVTMGDPAGIGIEITAKAWRDRDAASLPPFFLIGSLSAIRSRLDRIKLDIPLREIADAAEAKAVFPSALPVLALGPNATETAQTVEAIRLGTELCLSGAAAALVTNPIHKKRLYDDGFTHPGHTEYLAALTGREGRSVMMLACPALKVVPATVHVPIREVPSHLTIALLHHVASTTHTDLIAHFGIARPRLVVAGLNPHAGEAGSIGDEEITIITPAIEQLQAAGLDVRGPFPADSLFHDAARKTYDAAICMYHDQALIPLKTLDFEG